MYDGDIVKKALHVWERIVKKNSHPHPLENGAFR
jgi:hypothetical protein